MTDRLKRTLNVEDAVAELATLRDFVRWSVSAFIEHEIHLGHGFDDPWDESMMLVLACVHLPWDIDPRVLDAKLTRAERTRVAAWVRQRVEERIPTAYITGEAWFAGLRFRADERVLIPRSPISELIEKHFEPWIEPGTVGAILDLCTGSGCIGIACAKAFPDAIVDCADLSEEALDVAEENVRINGVEGQVNLIYSDLFAALDGRSYDIIVSNPPYVDDADMAALPPEYRHEPEMALTAGQEGLDIVRRMLPKLARHLNPGGIAVVEVGNSRQALEDSYPSVPFTWLEFERGDAEVFVFTREELVQYHPIFRS
jgi:ribosomal protein L3 glutamine methyltransferase